MKRKYRYVDGKWIPDIPLTPEEEAANAARLQEMIATQSFPGIQTDTTFLAGRGTLDTQLGGGNEAEAVARAAMKHGYRPNINDVYEPGLADFMGDPKAFIPATGGRAEVVRRAADADKSVIVGTREYRRPRRQRQGIKLAESTVQRYMKEELKRKPDADRRALRDKIIAEHAFSK
jgi:hypothetical protein